MFEAMGEGIMAPKRLVKAAVGDRDADYIINERNFVLVLSLPKDYTFKP